MIKRSIVILMSALFISAIALSGCSNGGDTKEATSATTSATTEAATISESEAQDIALESAGITETAAEDLKVEVKTVKGVKAYVFSFSWSGYDYQYSVDMSTGDLVEKIFDGSVIN